VLGWDGVFLGSPCSLATMMLLDVSAMAAVVTKVLTKGKGTSWHAYIPHDQYVMRVRFDSTVLFQHT